MIKGDMQYIYSCTPYTRIDPAFFLFTYYHGPLSSPYIPPCHAPLLNSDPNDNIFLMRKWHTEQTIVNFQHLKTAVITLSVVSTPVRGYNWKMPVMNYDCVWIKVYNFQEYIFQNNMESILKLMMVEFVL